jgi:hypothetical protein
MTAPARHDAVAVYPSEHDARAAADAVARAGIAPRRVSVDDTQARRASLRSEMRDEIEGAVMAPQASVALTREMVSGVTVAVPVAALAGAVVGLPFGFMTIGGLDLWARLLLAAGIGGFCGSVVGVIVGAAVGASGPAEPMAAERGVTVRVRDADDDVLRLLAERDPIRLDVVAPDGSPEVSTHTPAPDAPEAGRRIADRLTQGSGDWSRVNADRPRK